MGAARDTWTYRWIMGKAEHWQEDQTLLLLRGAKHPCLQNALDPNALRVPFVLLRCEEAPLRLRYPELVSLPIQRKQPFLSSSSLTCLSGSEPNWIPDSWLLNLKGKSLWSFCCMLSSVPGAKIEKKGRKTCSHGPQGASTLPRQIRPLSTTRLGNNSSQHLTDLIVVCLAQVPCEVQGGLWALG